MQAAESGWNMIPQTHAENAKVAAVLEMRYQADRLLRRLIAERHGQEQRYREAGKRDPMKEMTGCSAMDDAVQEARRMREHLDGMLRSLLRGEARQGRSEPSRDAAVHATTSSERVPVAVAP